MSIPHVEPASLCMCDDCQAREQREYDEAQRPHPEDGTTTDDGAYSLEYDWFGDSQPDADEEVDPEQELAYWTRLLAESDPTRRYRLLTREQRVATARTRRCSMERAAALQELHRAGLSYGQIVQRIGGDLTRARVQQLVERGRA